MQAELLRILAHQHGDQAGHDNCYTSDQQHGQAPAVGLDDRRLARQEDELARGRAGGKDDGHQTAAPNEPARGHHRAQDQGHRPGAETDQHTPQRNELPRRLHERAQTDAGGEGGQRDEHDAAHAEAGHQRAGERSTQAVQQQVDRERQRHGRSVPAEVVFEGQDEHGVGGADARRCEQSEEGDPSHDPRVVETHDQLSTPQAARVIPGCLIGILYLS